MKFVNTFALMCLAFASSKAMRNIPSRELVKEIKIGWNLGNTLDAHCLDALDYAEDQLASETCWGNVKTTPELFQKLHSLGFNIFRIPTTWTGHFGEGPDYKIDDAWMKRVHEVVDYALNTGSFAILNIHHENWNYAYAENLEPAKEILEAIWKQIAAEFANYDEHLIFEGMNEPRKVGDAVEWTGGDQEGWDFVNELDNLFYNTVRASGGNNAIRHLMLPPYAAGAYGGAPDHFIYPENDDKVIVSIHAYSPYSFALDNGEGAVSTFEDASEIDGTMGEIKKFFISKNVPVILGEFGAMNRHNEDERAKWAEYYIKSAKSIGVPCILWDNGIFEGEGERFAIIDRSQLKIAYPKLVTGLMRGLGEYNYSIPESDIIEIVEEEEPSVTEPTIEPITPTTTEPVVQQPTTNEPVPNQGATTLVDPTYFTCGAQDWQCKSEKSDICFSEVSKCWGSGKDAETCTKISFECSKIWN
ncbi:cellulase-domain-containing protein [Piromyces finnis]|uniref:Cellulase-domain-containing protein n=1 Tax=Piromyces finnis TaxID=1754191 RepID=A0A1Y1V376_9FUNG|nr:cellulase-domain-containing protein [Piromyces finnis]|eukprot:ORX44859.1 cellulase-domain-containing protein [Piromyces finnis]